MSKIKKIGVLTSGGDSPGMNAAIRAVVRTAISQGISVCGIKDGYLGLKEENIINLDRTSVSETINRGGTFLGTARFPEFKEASVRDEAIKVLEKNAIDALVVIGGDGSYMGAKKLSESGVPCIGIPGTIDNDIPGTDYTIGFDTALNVVVEALDRLRDTSGSHKRISIVEVMGRYCGDLSLHSCLASGAEYVVVPERGFNKKEILDLVLNSPDHSQKTHIIIVVCEHVTDCNALAAEIEYMSSRETRATILGHIQRGGTPTARDRVLATRMGAFAVELLAKGESGCCIGIRGNELVHHDIIECLTNQKKVFDASLHDLIKALA